MFNRKYTYVFRFTGIQLGCDLNRHLNQSLSKTTASRLLLFALRDKKGILLTLFKFWSVIVDVRDRYPDRGDSDGTRNFGRVCKNVDIVLLLLLVI